MEINEQIKHWEAQKSDSALQYRGAKVAFTYYIVGIAIAILGYLINSMQLIDLKQPSYIVTLVALALCFLSGTASVILDCLIKLNDFARIDCLINQRPEAFYKYVKDLYALDKWEKMTTVLSLILLMLSFVSCFCWKYTALQLLANL